MTCLASHVHQGSVFNDLRRQSAVVTAHNLFHSTNGHESRSRAEPARPAAASRAARHAARRAAAGAPDLRAQRRQQDERPQRRHDHRAHTFPAQVSRALFILAG